MSIDTPPRMIAYLYVVRTLVYTPVVAVSLLPRCRGMTSFSHSDQYIEKYVLRLVARIPLPLPKRAPTLPFIFRSPFVVFFLSSSLCYLLFLVSSIL